MLLGDTKFLHLRVDIDENDAWRVRPGASALAFIRGNPDLNAPLQFERFEPYVIPKVSLTGQSTERTDTRVLQVIYSFDPAALPVYVGQQMDIVIQAPPIAEASAPAQPPSGNIP
jgi:HlyD family secretion protein